MVTNSQSMDSRRAPVVVNPVLRHAEERRINLSGAWGFRLDPDERGIVERWFDSGLFLDKIEVPGTWQGQGFGGTEEKYSIAGMLPEAQVLRATYSGSGWYARSFEVPKGWEGQRLWLNFGAVHPSAEVWVNGERMGENHAPFVPFGFEITDVVDGEGENRVTVRVHEEARRLGMMFNLWGHWSGLYRDVELTATGLCCLERFWVYPEVDEERMRFEAVVDGLDRLDGVPSLRVRVQPLSGEGPVATAEVAIEEEVTAFELDVPDPELWSPDEPSLYRVDVELNRGAEVMDCLSQRTGFVKLSTEGKRFLINDEPYYMRGTGDFMSSPETGSPDTDRERWRRRLRTLRAYGYNYVRCQSYAPVPEYLEVADEVGLLVQSEMGAVAPWGGGFDPRYGYRGWAEATPGKRKALKWQWDRVVMRDVNHPSANLYCMSNELGSETRFPRIAWQCYHDTKAIKPTALVIWTDGGHNEALPGDFVNDDPQHIAWKDRAWRSFDQESLEKPLIAHEYRWWASYIDVRIASKFRGATMPFAQKLAVEAASRHGLVHVLAEAAENSQRLHFVEAKGKFEMCRRDNPRLAGICHWRAIDLLNTAHGILDPFYDEKVTDSETWLETNGETVVLCDLGFGDRVLRGGDALRCAFSVSDYGHPPLEHPGLAWQLVVGQEVVEAGEMQYEHEPYLTCSIGEIVVSVPDVVQPQAGRVEVVLREGEREVTNGWDVWVFPREVGLPSSLGIYGEAKHTWLKGLEGVPAVGAAELGGEGGPRAVLTERLDEALVAFAREGSTVVLAASEGLVRPFPRKWKNQEERYFFLPLGNSIPWEFNHQGTIIKQHPMLGEMPHEGFADLQFFRMMGTAPALDLEPFDLNQGDPVIRAMHLYLLCHPLAYLVECSLGEGTLIISALELDQGWPEARYMLGQICDHAVSERSEPMLELSDEAITKLIEETSIP